MYLSNTTSPFLSYNSIFQNRTLFSANAGLSSPAEKPQIALQTISDQIVSNQTRDEQLEEQSKTAQIWKDTYMKTKEDTPDEERSTGALKLLLDSARLLLTVSEKYEQELSDFKEQLQGWDQTIQGYQDILDGKAALPEGQTIQNILWSYKKAKLHREEFLQDGIAYINESRYGEAFSVDDDCTLKDILEEETFTKLASKDPSDWLLDPTASDLYSEIDHLLSEAHGVTEGLWQGVEHFYNILRKRGYGEQYKGYLESWVDPTDSYFDQTEKMNIQKLMIDRLMKEPLQQL